MDDEKGFGRFLVAFTFTVIGSIALIGYTNESLPDWKRGIGLVVSELLLIIPAFDYWSNKLKK